MRFEDLVQPTTSVEPCTAVLVANHQRGLMRGSSCGQSPAWNHPQWFPWPITSVESRTVVSVANHQRGITHQVPVSLASACDTEFKSEIRCCVFIHSQMLIN